MGNLETIIRTMTGFSYQNLILIEPSADIFDPKVIRSSMGSLFQINFRYFKSMEDYLKTYPNNIYCFSLQGSETLPEVTPQKPFALVFGNEGRGLPTDFIKICMSSNRKRIVKSILFPQSSKIDSLNLSVSASIVLYNYRRNI